MTDRDDWGVAVWITCGFLFLLVLALAGTGLWLAMNYRPSSAGLRGTDVPPMIAQVRRMQSVHRGLAWVACVDAWLVAVAVIGRAAARRPGAGLQVGASAALVVATLAASFTGYLLPWDQLALRAVTVGSHYGGVWKAGFSSGVRFVLLDHAEIGQRTYQRWLLVHVVALGPVIVTLLAGILWRLRRRDDVRS